MYSNEKLLLKIWTFNIQRNAALGGDSGNRKFL